jgi:23S rRNA pseudouridine955/2504/2580 synthase
MTAPITIPINDTDGEARLDRLLRRRFPGLTQGRIEMFLRRGLVKVDGERIKQSSFRLEPGMVLSVHPALAEVDDQHPARTGHSVSVEDERLLRDMVLHEDDDMIVLNKAAGIAVQGGTGTERHLDGLMAVFAHPEHGKPKLVHRLDRDTSGVLVFGRNPAATTELGKAFRARTTQKVYWAVCLGVPHPLRGEIRGWMKKAGSAMNPDRELMRRAAHGDKEALFAITDYEVITNAGTRASWVALKPVTGRTHQLRFHMAEAGCAIAGDGKYVCDRPQIGGLAEQLHLHARALRIPHPQGGTLTLVADLPDHMREAFDLLGFELGEAKDPFAPFKR